MSMQWGCPWHGAVEGGQLTLPSGSTLAWPQPPGDTADDAGFTLHARMPDVPPVERTAEELAADAAEGMQWLASAIIAGAGRQESADTGAAYLHGRNVNGWIYAAPDGSRWLVRGLGRKRMYSSDLSMTLSLSRFGVLGGKARSYSVSASITAAQQDQEAWSSNFNESEADYRYWQVQDVGAGGDRAIVMTYIAKSKTLPLGFVRLALSGTPGVDLAATLTKLAGRAERVTDTVEVDAGVAEHRGYAPYSEEIIPDYPWYPSDPWAYYTERTYGAVAWESGDGLPDDAEVFVTAHVGSGESRSAATYLVAMWFDAAGVPQPVHLRVDNRAVMSFPVPSLSVSGKLTSYRRTGATTEYPAVDLSRNAAISETLTLELTFGGAAVAYERRRNVTFTESFHLQGGEVEVASTRLPGSWKTTRYTYAIDGDDGFSSQWTMEGEWEWYQPPSQPAYWKAATATVTGDRVPWQEGDNIIGTSNPATVSASATLSAGTLSVGGAWLLSPEVRLGLRRHSNTLLCLQIRSQRAATSPLAATDPGIKIASRSLSPAGLGPESADVAESGARFEDILPYGSHNPLTGASAICRAEPVSWT